MTAGMNTNKEITSKIPCNCAKTVFWVIYVGKGYSVLNTGEKVNVLWNEEA